MSGEDDGVMSLLDRIPGRRGTHASGSGDRRSRAAGQDALRLAVDYVKQETLGPLRGLGRYLAFGIAGSLLLACGVILLLVALLRVLQAETGSTFAGNLSWLPYGIVAVVALGVAVAAAWRTVRGPAAKRPTEHAERTEPAAGGAG